MPETFQIVYCKVKIQKGMPRQIDNFLFIRGYSSQRKGHY